VGGGGEGGGGGGGGGERGLLPPLKSQVRKNRVKGPFSINYGGKEKTKRGKGGVARIRKCAK